jgi:hypothetical protein
MGGRAGGLIRALFFGAAGQLPLHPSFFIEKRRKTQKNMVFSKNNRNLCLTQKFPNAITGRLSAVPKPYISPTEKEKKQNGKAKSW